MNPQLNNKYMKHDKDLMNTVYSLFYILHYLYIYVTFLL